MSEPQKQPRAKVAVSVLAGAEASIGGVVAVGDISPGVGVTGSSSELKQPVIGIIPARNKTVRIIIVVLVILVTARPSKSGSIATGDIIYLLIQLYPLIYEASIKVVDLVPLIPLSYLNPSHSPFLKERSSPLSQRGAQGGFSPEASLLLDSSLI